MIRPRQALATTLVIAGSLLSAATGWGDAPRKLGPWTVRTFAEGVPLCSAQTTYGNGVSLSFNLLLDGTWRIGLSNPAWTLPASGSAVAKVNVDGEGRSVLATARPAGAALLLIDVGSLDPLETLPTGRRLHLDIAGRDGMPDEEHQLRLANVAELIPAIRDCVDALRARNR